MWKELGLWEWFFQMGWRCYSRGREGFCWFWGGPCDSLWRGCWRGWYTRRWGWRRRGRRYCYRGGRGFWVVQNGRMWWGCLRACWMRGRAWSSWCTWRQWRVQKTWCWCRPRWATWVWWGPWWTRWSAIPLPTHTSCVPWSSSGIDRNGESWGQ